MESVPMAWWSNDFVLDEPALDAFFLIDSRGVVPVKRYSANHCCLQVMTAVSMFQTLVWMSTTLSGSSNNASMLRKFFAVLEPRCPSNDEGSVTCGFPMESPFDAGPSDDGLYSLFVVFGYLWALGFGFDSTLDLRAPGLVATLFGARRL